MGCSDCYNGNVNQIPINIDQVLFNEVPANTVTKYAYYVDGETYF